jgi:hypothetical protein
VGVFGDVPMMFHLQAAVRQGFEQFSAQFVLRNIVVPVTLFLLDLVLLPFCLSRGLAIYLWPDSYMLQAFASRYAHLTYICVLVGYRSFKWTVKFLVKMHNDIRDTTLLEGAQLANR